MEWSPQQDVALRKTHNWRRFGNKPYFLLAGYAGTGKTTMAEELVSGESGKVFFAAYTGKAAHVLQKQGIPATTIHKLIYLPVDKCSAHLRKLQQERLDLLRARPVDEKALAKLDRRIDMEHENLKRPDFLLNTDSPLWDASLLVIDEYSMVDEQMGADLMSFGCPILALGDPGQLPPIQGRRFFMDTPDVMLTEIHRNAADSPIIRLSRDVREGRELVSGTYGESRVIKRSEISESDFDRTMLAADQVLVGTNNSRRNYNRLVRAHFEREGDFPVANDKLVCLRNNHKEGLLNGQTWLVEGVRTAKSYLRLSLWGEDGEEVTCLAHKSPFLENSPSLDPWERKRANEFDFGYALTVHKAQGSEWDNVFLDDEWRWENRDKWLYTGITRAAKRITIVR